MNNEEENNLCPKCGTKLPPNGFCLRCGFNGGLINNNVNSEVQNNQIEQSSQINESNQENIENDYETTFEEEEKRKKKRNLILSIINILLIVPVISSFAGVWIVFGALNGSSAKYYGISWICIIYIIVSYIFLLFSIINMFTKNKVNKICKIIAVVLLAFYLFGPTIEKQKQKYYYINQLSKVSMEEKYVLENDQMKVKQKSISIDGSSANINFTVEKMDGTKYSCDNNYPKFRVNGYNMTQNNLANEKSSIITDTVTNDCVLKITHDDLKGYNINEISTVDLWIGNAIVNFKTDSTKENSTNNLSFLNKEEYLLHENDYFKVYYNPKLSYDSVDLYFVSKIKEDYYVYFLNENLDTPGLVTGNTYSVLLYDNTISKGIYYFQKCRSNLSYYKAHYVIVTNDNNRIEGDIDEKYGASKINDFCNKN